MQPAPALYTVKTMVLDLSHMKGGVSLKRSKVAPDGSFIHRDYRIWYWYGGQQHFIYSDLNGKPFRDYGIATDAYERAVWLWGHILKEIEAHKHDPSRYKPIHKSRFSVANVINAYLEAREKDIERGSVGKSQVKKIRLALKYFTDHLSTSHVDDVRDVRAFHLQEHYNRLPKKRGGADWKPKQVKNHLANIGAFIRWAHRMEYIPQIPTLPSMPNVPHVNIKFYTDAEQRRVIDAIPDNHRAIFEFMAWCGCRPSEARALRVQDVDIKAGVILIRSAFNDSGELDTTKTDRPRPLPVDAEIEGILAGALQSRKVLQIHNRPGEFVFVNPSTGTHYTVEELRYQWCAGIEASGVRALSITEGTRKTVATRLINNGVEPHIISDILGNSPMVLKAHYAQITARRYAGILGHNAPTMPKGRKAKDK